MGEITKNGTAFALWFLTAMNIFAVALIQAFASAAPANLVGRVACGITLFFCTELVETPPAEWSAKARTVSLQLLAMQILSLGYFLYTLFAPAHINPVKPLAERGLNARPLVITGEKDPTGSRLVFGVHVFGALFGLALITSIRFFVITSLSAKTPSRSIYGLDVWVSGESVGWGIFVSSLGFLACHVMARRRGHNPIGAR